MVVGVAVVLVGLAVVVVGLSVVVAGLDVVVSGKYLIEIINNKARHNLIDTKCRLHSD